MLKCIAVIGAIVWITAIFFVYVQLTNNQTPASDTSIRNWRKTLELLDHLKEQNDELRNILETERKERNQQHQKILSHQNGNSKVEDTILPTTQPRVDVQDDKKSSGSLGNYAYEIDRRLLDDRIREMFYAIHKQPIDNSTKEVLENQMISLMGLSSKLEYESEGNRKIERKNLSKRIIKSITKLQNPDKCDSAQVLVCNLDKECGFGCQLHHVTYCAITAFATQRMLILRHDGSSWKGWISVFEPISSKCTYETAVGKTPLAKFSEDSKDRVVHLGIVDSLGVKPTFLPQAIPLSMSQDLSMLHSHPPAFFIGTFISYLMRFNQATLDKLDAAYREIPTNNGPVVGLQIRRTDKVGTEAAFHSLAEYMIWTEYWFRVEEKRVGKPLERKIFIASDDPTVVPEAKEKYPNYKVFGSTEIAQTAQLSNRYTDGSLMGVITDIYILSKMDYLVCTFSSQVCRMGYELRQPFGEDDGTKFHSLDDIYYFGGQQAHDVVAIEDHTARANQEIDLKVGDKVGIAGNHWDGYSKGTNRRSNRVGIFPSYKVVNDWRTYDFKAML